MTTRKPWQCPECGTTIARAACGEGWCDNCEEACAAGLEVRLQDPSIRLFCKAHRHHVCIDDHCNKWMVMR